MSLHDRGARGHMGRMDPMARGLTVALALTALGALGACANAGRLAEYDFRDRTVSVVAHTPPTPRVFTGDGTDLTGETVVGALVRIGTGITKELQAGRARARLDSAAWNTDVAGRMAERLLERGARTLRARALPDGGGDFEIEVRVRKYGIEADDWDARAEFYLDAEVRLLDGTSGTVVWKDDVDEREPVNAGVFSGSGAVDDLVTAQALAALTVGEMEMALQYLADYSADRIDEMLRRGLEKARGD